MSHRGVAEVEVPLLQGGRILRPGKGADGDLQVADGKGGGEIAGGGGLELAVAADQKGQEPGLAGIQPGPVQGILKVLIAVGLLQVRGVERRGRRERELGRTAVAGEAGVHQALPVDAEAQAAADGGALQERCFLVQQQAMAVSASALS